MFYGGFDVQKQAVWYKVKIQAQDQFRQRASWALAQLLVVTLNQVCIPLVDNIVTVIFAYVNISYSC